jgi:integrase
VKASAVTKADVQRMISGVIAGETARGPVKTKLRGRATIRGGSGIAPRVLAATRAMFGWAVEQGILKANPASGIDLPARAPKERFLSLEEARNLLAKLDELENDGEVSEAHADIVRLLLFTGARRGEITGLRAAEVDLERKRLVLPPERTKAGGKTGVRRVPLSAPAIEILTKYSDCKGHLFPAARGEGPTTGLGKSWETIKGAADLPGVRLHDLRHSWASAAVADGASLFLVGKVLGHANARTTERYAHLTDDPLLALAERAGERLARKPKPNAGETSE